MTFDPQKPRYTLNFAGKDYELEGNFALIEAVEHTMKDHVFSVLSRCLSMPASDLAKLLYVILKMNKVTISASEIGDILWNDIGVVGEAYTLLCLHVHAFLRITVAKPVERAEVAAKMGEMLGKVNPPTPSLGNTTDNSPSAL